MATSARRGLRRESVTAVRIRAGRDSTMTNSPAFRVRLVDWREASETLARIRTTVFVEGQGVPPAIEMDGRDGECAHALAESSSGAPIGTGRLMPDGRIGRM